MEFQVGDRVAMILGANEAKPAIIRHINHDPHTLYAIEFEDRVRLQCHNCGGKVPSGNGWWASDHTAELIEEAPEPKELVTLTCVSYTKDSLEIIRSVGGDIRFSMFHEERFVGSVHLDSDKLVELRDHLDLLLGDVIYEPD